MIFLHTSDLHIGKRLHEVSLLTEQRYILSEICRIAEENHCDAVVVAGDIYDKSAPSAEAVSLFDWFVTELYRRGIALIADYGNHDSADRVAYASSLLNKSGIYLSPRFDGTVTKVVLPDPYGEVTFHLLPFLKPITVSAAYDGTEFSSYDDAVQYVVEQCTDYTDCSARNVMICHQYVTGGERSESEEVPVGGLDNISAGIFQCFDYCALGHLHKPQRIGRDTMRYSGSPLKYSLDEYSNEKSVVLVTLKEKGDCSIRLIPLKPLHDVRQIKGTYAELTLRQNYQGTRIDDFLHVILTDEDYVPDALFKLRTIYPNILKLEYANVRTSYHADLTDLSGMSGDVQLTPMEMFAELYRIQNNAPLGETGVEFAKNLFNHCME